MGLGVLAVVVGFLGVGVGSAAAQLPYEPNSVMIALPTSPSTGQSYDTIVVDWTTASTSAANPAGTIAATSFEVGYVPAPAATQINFVGVVPTILPVAGGAEVRQYVLGGLKGDTRYVVGVRAVREAATSPTIAEMKSIWVFGAPAFVETNMAPRPSTIDARNIEVKPADMQLIVEWQPPQSAGGTGLTITDYDIRYFPTAGTVAMAEEFPHVGTATTATITGLTNGTMYSIQIRATNSGEGESLWSTAKTGTPDPAGAIVLPPIGEAPAVMKYASCTALQVDWSKGVAKAGGTYRTAWNANEIATYGMNTDLDRDKDMVACETGGEGSMPGEVTPAAGTPAKVVINPVEKAAIKAKSITISWMETSRPRRS
jgi:hypothetical protein